MKSIVLTIMILISSKMAGQLITVKLDTTQFFEHSALLSTPQAIELGKLVYKDLYEHKTKLILAFDFNNMKESYLKYEFAIVKINKSSNIIDVVVDENGNECQVVLGETHEGGLMYIFEYRDGDLIKGFFSKDPEFFVSEAQPQVVESK
ncbi:MAG: hypothetical protein ACKOZM_04680 [Flavobacteriales bacterium]